MAQLVARLVRNEKVGGSNPPSSTTGRHPIRMSVFCMPGRVGVVPVVVLLVAPLVFRALRCDALWGPAAVCAGGRRPAREIATREPAARSGRSRGPPWPCRHPPAPRPGPPVPPAPSTPAVLCCCVWLSASSRSPPWPRRRPSSFARNSLATISNIEFRSLQLQRFQTLLKFLPIELCARFLWSCPCRPSNVACNSLTALSNYEFRLLELQRF